MILNCCGEVLESKRLLDCGYRDSLVVQCRPEIWRSKGLAGFQIEQPMLVYRGSDFSPG
jgi:hypothetical protein